MIFLLAVVLFILGVVLLVKANTQDVTKIIAGCLLVILSFCLCLLACYIPYVYEEPVLTDSHELSMTVIDGREIYVSNAGDEYVFYTKTEVVSVEGKKTVVNFNYSDGDVEIITEQNCKMPRVEIYLQKGKTSFWTSFTGRTKNMYKIYVPEGTIFESDN